MKTLITFAPQCRVSTQYNEGAHGCRFTTEAISILPTEGGYRNADHIETGAVSKRRS